MSSWLKKKKSFFLWLLLTAGIGGWLTYIQFYSEDKTPLLPGVTTHGHYQIEMQCAACHDNEKAENVFTSSGVSNKACNACHGEDLEQASDSHPVRKFKNPENAIFLEHVDAMRCVACHSEHNEKITGPMAVTVPQDYCAHCHEVTLENLESHKHLPYNSCATSGCHNYHDNVALAPGFLVKHYGEPDVLEKFDHIQTDTLKRWLEEGNEPRAALTKNDQDAPASVKVESTHVHDWATTVHARAGINCSDCHEQETNESPDWVNSPSHETCAQCHTIEHTDFLKGKHGMRLAHEGLSPMTPGDARLEMHTDAAHKSLSCNSCHQAHEFDRFFASYQACVQCHNDEHTKNYTESHHFTLWQKEVSGEGAPGSGVSCATCHMPREKRAEGIVVNHNQNANLRPNEKMLQNVCMDCHGMQFSMNAMADEKLINSCFNGKPSVAHEGITWAANAAIERGDERVIEIRNYLESLKQSSSEEPSSSADAEETPQQ